MLLEITTIGDKIISVKESNVVIYNSKYYRSFNNTGTVDKNEPRESVIHIDIDKVNLKKYFNDLYIDVLILANKMYVREKVLDELI